MGRIRRFFFACSHLLRNNMGASLLDRPLLWGLLLGALTDSTAVAVPMALFFELFWLDVLRLGAVTPPSASMAFLLLFPCALLFQWTSPHVMALPLVICLLMAHTAPYLERWLRRQNDKHIAAVEVWLSASPDEATSCEAVAQLRQQAQSMSPAAFVAYSLLRTSVCAALLYGLCFALLYGICDLFIQRHILPSSPYISWELLYVLALAGPLLALRERSAYKSFALSALLAVLAFMLVSF